MRTYILLLLLTLSPLKALSNDGEFHLRPIVNSIKNEFRCYFVSEKQRAYYTNNKEECIISFIDDDSGKYIPDIWGPIIDSTGIKMGFAVITGFIGEGLSAPEVFEPTELAYLDSLYNAGHDLYSHSYTHHEFFKKSTTLEDLDTQCSNSRHWMLENGYTRNLNIIVYPGGLGDGKVEKKNIVREYYQYGIDAYGGLNDEPLDNWSVKRFNADTASIYTLKRMVDKAYETKKLLVFMNHAYELNKDRTYQVDKIYQLIEYIKSKNIKIMPLSKALDMKGNVLAEGEYTYPNSLFVSINGKTNRAYDISAYKLPILFCCLISLIAGIGIAFLTLRMRKNNKQNVR